VEVAMTEALDRLLLPLAHAAVLVALGLVSFQVLAWQGGPGFAPFQAVMDAVR
jgi:hypothetical protein